MPDTAAHYFFGQQVLKRLPDDIAGMIRRNMPVFNLGLQGPDLLFYYKPLKNNPVSALGAGIHWQIAAGRITLAAEALRGQWDEAAFSYLMGYVCHFVLDSSFHGDISRMAPETRSHFLLEAELDRQIILKHYTKRPASFKRHALVRTRLKSYACLQSVYPELTEKELKGCARQMFFYLWLLYSPLGVKKKLVRAAEKALGKAGFFSAMIVPGRPNEAFYRDAQGLFSRMAGLEEKGVKAVRSAADHIRGGGALDALFQKNFE